MHAAIAELSGKLAAGTGDILFNDVRQLLPGSGASSWVSANLAAWIPY